MSALAESAYRGLLGVLPRHLRRSHGDDMVLLFTELHREVRTEKGRLAAVRFSAASLLRLILAGVGARFSGDPRPPVSPALSDPRQQESTMSAILRDARFGVRTLVRSPGYAAIVVCTLALAIGVNTTIYSMVRTLMAPPLPFENQEELIVPIARNPEIGRGRAGFSLPDLSDIEPSASTLAGIGGQQPESVAFTGGERPVRIRAARVTASFFPTLGVAPELGRTFGAADVAPGSDPVVLLGHSAWERHFASDPAILGRTVSVDGTEHTVVGVMPAALEIGSGQGIEIYRPFVLTGDTPRDQRSLWVYARLAPDATLEQARAELMGISENLRELHPETNLGWEFTALGFREAMVGPNANVVVLLMTVSVGFVLLIACANVANLTLARAYRRSRELSLRAALGAGRASLVRTLLVESSLLALAAGALGLLVTRLIFNGLAAAGRGNMSLFEVLHIDTGVMTFSLGLAALTPILFGLWPALRACRSDITTALKEGGSAGIGRREQRLRRVMVGAQVAMAVTLLIVSGLATRSVAKLLDIELGFEPDRMLTFRMTTLSEIDETTSREQFEAARLRIAALPGVEAAGMSRALPVAGGDPSLAIHVDGAELAASEATQEVAGIALADPGYFEVLDMPVLQGRPVSGMDAADTLPVAVVNRAAAERFWPEGGAVGGRVRIASEDEPWREVVGVVGNLRNPDADQPTLPLIYVPFAQSPGRSMAFVVRTERDPLALAPSVRDAVWSVNPDQPIENVRSMHQVRYDDMVGDIVIIGLLGFFALVALALAIAGVYGVVSYSVGQRTREIGIRLAVGARASDVSRMVARQGLIMVMAGAIVGVGTGLLMGRLLSGMLYGISPLDPVTFVGVPAILALVGILAAAIPARRAARLDPAWTLRPD